MDEFQKKFDELESGKKINFDYKQNLNDTIDITEESFKKQYLQSIEKIVKKKTNSNISHHFKLNNNTMSYLKKPIINNLIDLKLKSNTNSEKDSNSRFDLLKRTTELNMNKNFDRTIKLSREINNLNSLKNLDSSQNQKEIINKIEFSKKDNDEKRIEKLVKQDKLIREKEMKNFKVNISEKGVFDHYPSIINTGLDNKIRKNDGFILVDNKNLNPFSLLQKSPPKYEKSLSESENNLLNKLNSFKRSNDLSLSTESLKKTIDGKNDKKKDVNKSNAFKATIIEDIYKNMTFDLNEPLKNVLDFEFFKKQSQKLFTESFSNRSDGEILDNLKIPNDFISKNHYRYIMKNNFMEEFKYSLLSAKGEDKDIKKYKDLKIKSNLIPKNNYIDSILMSFTFNLNDKSKDKKKILKENDLFALINEREMADIFISRQNTINSLSEVKFDNFEHSNFSNEENIHEKISIESNKKESVEIKLKRKSNYVPISFDLKDKRNIEQLEKFFDDIYDQFSLTNTKNYSYRLGMIKYEKASSNNKNDVTDILCYILNSSLNLNPILENDIFYFKYLGNITSSLREINSILHIDDNPFKEIILNPINYLNRFIDESKESNSTNKNSDEPQTILFKKKCNDEKIMKNFLSHNKISSILDSSQFQAIKNCSGKEDFVLIQGPPGTGKTHTILFIISMFYSIPNSKILICAPSNSAIDEIAIRLHNVGILDKNFKSFKPDFIRFGITEKSSGDTRSQLNGEQLEILKNYSLEKLVENKFKEVDNAITQDIEKIKEKIKGLEQKKKQCLVEKLDDLERNITENKRQLKIFLSEKANNRNNKKIYENELLEKTRILCTTLNSSGHNLFTSNNISFDFLIIDEACQCVEPSAIIPMQLTKQKVIMVGDHIQLPATVFYQHAEKTRYNRSLFERLIDNDFPKEILTIQYRMQSNIREFVGKTFYDNVLKDSLLIQERMDKSTIYKIIEKNMNFSFFNLDNSKEKFCNKTKSYYNEVESEMIILLIKNIQKKLEFFNFNENVFNKNQLNFKIAIIAPYKAQVRHLIDSVENYIPEYKNYLEINTVDSFQGREQDIIIISCVRSNYEDLMKKENIGFLNDFRRMNVALSRAKFGCFIVGNYFTLINNKNWSKLMKFCIKRNNFFTFDKEFFDAYKNHKKELNFLNIMDLYKKDILSSSRELKNILLENDIEDDSNESIDINKIDHRIASTEKMHMNNLNKINPNVNEFNIQNNTNGFEFSQDFEEGEIFVGGHNQDKNNFNENFPQNKAIINYQDSTFLNLLKNLIKKFQNKLEKNYLRFNEKIHEYNENKVQICDFNQNEKYLNCKKNKIMQKDEQENNIFISNGSNNNGSYSNGKKTIILIRKDGSKNFIEKKLNKESNDNQSSTNNMDLNFNQDLELNENPIIKKNEIFHQNNSNISTKGEIQNHLYQENSFSHLNKSSKDKYTSNEKAENNSIFISKLDILLNKKVSRTNFQK